jgi:hypothetical protein
MTRVEFANLLFRLEELLIEVDYYRRKINDCHDCRGEDIKNMCPACLRALRSEFESMKKLSGDAEFMEIMRTIKGALHGDATGELAEIMALARRGIEN